LDFFRAWIGTYPVGANKESADVILFVGQIAEHPIRILYLPGMPAGNKLPYAKWQVTDLLRGYETWQVIGLLYGDGGRTRFLVNDATMISV